MAMTRSTSGPTWLPGSAEEVIADDVRKYNQRCFVEVATMQFGRVHGGC